MVLSLYVNQPVVVCCAVLYNYNGHVQYMYVCLYTVHVGGLPYCVQSKMLVYLVHVHVHVYIHVHVCMHTCTYTCTYLQLDRKTVDELDSNLTEGQEMDILYHELMKTIPKDYLDMESVSENACMYYTHYTHGRIVRTSDHHLKGRSHCGTVISGV